MLKMLKTDFYKIVKSKMLLAFSIITLCIVFFNPIIGYCASENLDSVYASLDSQFTILYGTLWIFVIPFATKDFSSKYMKNLSPDYSLTDRFFYVLSKVIYIFAFCVLFMSLQFIVEIIFNYIFGARCMYKITDRLSIGGFYLKYFVQMLDCMAIGVVLLFLCMLLKREYIVVIIIVPYIFFLSTLLYGKIDSAVGGNFQIEKYTVFGLPGVDDYNFVKKDFVKIIVSLICYIVLFTAGSCLVFAKKSLKSKAYNEKWLISVDKLKKSFGKKCILDDINLNIEKGEMYGLVGNNGAGKTTFLKLLCNMIRPSAGTITLNKGTFLSRVRIGALIESPALYFDMTAFQNIKLKTFALNIKYSKEKIYNLLELVGLQDAGRKNVWAFSMGMKQRLGIAMALVGDPDLLILDEPLNGLDPQGILEIRNLLEKIHKEHNITVVLSSHILDELAKTATRFCVLNKGKIIKNCTKEQFLAECGEKDITEYYLQLIQIN